MNKFVKLGINFGLIGIVTAGLIVGNNVVKEHESEIDTQLAPPIVDKQSQEVSGSKGQEMASRLIREGSVMLKNADNTLPLSKENKQVNVFGWRSVDWIYGSEGKNASGGVSPDHFDFDENIDIYKALEKYGVAYNKKLYDMYYQFRKPNHQSANIKGTHINNLTPLKEPFITDKKYYTDELLNYSQSFSDTAIVVIGRMAGEGMNADTKTQVKEGPGAVNDETRHYLEISKEEEELLKYCGENFKNVVVLLNVANPFECGFLNDIPGIDACLYIGFTGTQAAVALPGLLYGDVSPSGHTIDTFAYDLFSNPANTWVGGEKFTDFNVTYTDHMENIYVGYKWYETADTMGIWNDVNNNYGKGYDGVVQFPFGYGLSYNTYSWKVGSITKVTEVEEVKDGKTVKTEKETPFAPGDSFTDKDKLVFPVTVKNNGEYPGQDVVEIYVTAPWTQGGIEKSSVMLSAFEKTSVLQPGQEEEIKLEIDPYDFASYDCYDKDSNNFKGWELEGGDYTFKVQTDSHHVKEVEYDSKVKPGEFTFKIDSTINIENDPVTNQPVKNLFTGEDAIDKTPIDADEGDVKADIPWISRNDMKKPEEYAALYAPRPVTPSAKSDNTYSLEQAQKWDSATTDAFGNPVDTKVPTWGKSGNLKIADNGIPNELGKKLGADYDSPEWDALLDQITIPEAINEINHYYGSKAIPSIGKPALADLDGPAQIGGFVEGARGTGYPTMVVIAATWNPSLAYEFGKAFGMDMSSNSVYGLWGWALDSHRNAWFGRNHESPSEDALLAGRIVTNALKGLNTRGRYAFVKHLALYSYGGNHQYVTEQGLREIYLRPFRMAFVEGGALGAMTTYQGVGAEHSETTVALLEGVLRKEWQFKGALTTDYIDKNNLVEALIRAGGTLGMGVDLGKMGITYDQAYLDAHPRLSNRLREAMKQIIYVWLHADYYRDQYLLNPDKNDNSVSLYAINGWQWWKDLVLIINVCGGTILGMWALLTIISFVFHKDKKKKLAGIPETDTSAEPHVENIANEQPQETSEVVKKTEEPDRVKEKNINTDVSNLEIFDDKKGE